MANTAMFESKSLGKRTKSMLRADFKRMLKTKKFYILIACALLIPIIMTIMLTMMDGSESVNQQTGEITIMKGPDSVWESIGTLPSDNTENTENTETSAMGGMDVMSMCNINMMFMATAIFICIFISEDFRSGYVKNLFTVRVKKGDYVISKTIIGFVCGVLMLAAYFIGAFIGAAITGLSFELAGNLNVGNIVMCMLSKSLLMLVFVSIFVLVSVAAKSKAWLAICGSLGAGMLLFMMVSMITPLNSTMMNVLMCLAGGILFAAGLGAVSNQVLKKSHLI